MFKHVAVLLCSVGMMDCLASELQDDPKRVFALCAAANAILSSQMDEGMLADLIESEAQRHSDTALSLGATRSDLEQFVQAMAAAYNQGEISWSEISDLGQECAKF